MDKYERVTEVVNAINQHQTGEIEMQVLLRKVCEYFDYVKDTDIYPNDLKFLKYISNYVGVPHYYDMLERNFEKNIEINNIGLQTLASIMYESTLHTDNENKIHRYQKEVLNKFAVGGENRFVLTASTSFGKTHLVYEVIKKMKYKNVVLIFPTIALIVENLEKIYSNDQSNWRDYKVHTLSSAEYNPNEHNLFVFTPERFLSFIDKVKSNHNFDFIFIDEIYKIDNEYIIDEETKENERDLAYRLAVEYATLKAKDVLFAGPYVEFDDNSESRDSFKDFIVEKKLTTLNFNRYEIVEKDVLDVTEKRSYDVGSLKFEIRSKDKKKKLQTIIQSVLNLNENIIVYNDTVSGVEAVAKNIVELKLVGHGKNKEIEDFLEHLKSKFGEDWILIKGLQNFVGIHHGAVPKYIQKEIVTLFNKEVLKVLVSTTTITEGVNTTAKNVLVYSDKKGKKVLKTFDAKNIAGRAGRFMHHYKGRVLTFDNKFMQILDAEQPKIRHKNYDLTSPKDDIDLDITNDIYLSPSDLSRRNKNDKEQSDRNIPDEIMDLYKVVSKPSKIKVFDVIDKFTDYEINLIEDFITGFRKRYVNLDGLQLIINTIADIVTNEELKRCIVNKPRTGDNVDTTIESKYSILVFLLRNYVYNGFMGLVKYYVENKDYEIDVAIRKTAKSIYNLIKYQVVKYFGVFNVMYKYCKSTRENVKFDDVEGIDNFLAKLEYNATTEKGIKASDLGVPFALVEYYEDNESKSKKENFDKYESRIFDRVDPIIKKGDT